MDPWGAALSGSFPDSSGSHGLKPEAVRRETWKRMNSALGGFREEQQMREVQSQLNPRLTVESWTSYFPPRTPRTYPGRRVRSETTVGLCCFQVSESQKSADHCCEWRGQWSQVNSEHYSAHWARLSAGTR